MSATTLQLVGIKPLVNKAASVALIGGGNTPINELLDLEVSDLTLDANIMRQPLASDGSPALMTLQGVNALWCNNLVLRRVRIINWGPHCPGLVNGVIEHDKS